MKNNKISWLKLVENREQVIIELGCGQHKRFKDAIGIDCLELKDVDFVADLEKGLPFIPDDSVDIIYSRHVLEHISNISFFLSEISRVLKSGGVKIGWVPHWSNPYYYSDPTHKTFFGLYSFSYYTTNNFYKRNVPKFYQKNTLTLEKNLLLIIDNDGNDSIIKKCLMAIINLNYKTQEIYERYLSRIIPVDEIYFHLRKN